MSKRDSWWPERTQPRPVAGGIKAHSKRGAFAQQWWAKRWIAVLEGFELGARLARGRAYARAGQVIDIAIELGGVRAKVQGSRKRPYDVTIRIKELSPPQWRAVAEAISRDARLAAMLLAGEMPEDIETAFAAAGTALFPLAESHLKTACSCPDWSNPCKHVAAVFYLIGEEFDRDPFMLFVVRGLERTSLAALLTSGEAVAPKKPVKRSAPRIPRGKGPAESRPALAPSPAAFWGLETGDVARGGALEPPPANALVLARAGRFPFWRADFTLEEALSPVYAWATETSIEWLAAHAPHSKTSLS